MNWFFKTSKPKLLGISLLLLGAPSGLSLSTLDMSSFSLDEFFSPSSGGAITTSLLERDYDHKSLSLGNEVSDLQIIQEKEFKLSPIRESGEMIDLEEKRSLSDKDTTIPIKTIYSEKVKEDKVVNLNTESTEKTQKIISQSNQWLSDYNSAKLKVESFVSSSSSTLGRRSKRSVSSTGSYKLLPKERKALFEMYKLFDQMKKEKRELVPKLQAIEGSQTVTDESLSRPELPKLEESLTKIDWSTGQSIKYSDNLAPRGRSRVQRSTNPLWTDWSKNPLRYFLSSKGDYDALVNKVIRAQNEWQDHQNQRRLRGGMRAMFSHSPDRGRFEAEIEKSKSEIEHKVASKLLSWMKS